MNEIKVIEGGVTAAKGFKAAGAYAGIGKNAEKGDLALVYSNVPGNAAAVYTKNKVKAALPVMVTIEVIPKEAYCLHVWEEFGGMRKK